MGLLKNNALVSSICYSINNAFRYVDRNTSQRIRMKSFEISGHKLLVLPCILLLEVTGKCPNGFVSSA